MDTRLSQLSLVNDHTGATSNPIYLSTAYQHPGLGESTGFDYTRTKNPTRSQFEEAFAELEGGTHSFGTSSGMAAVQLVCNLFKPDDEILVSFDLYGGTFRLFDFYTKQYNIKFKYVDFADVDAVKEQLTRSQFEEAFAELEGGTHSFGTSSGMAAVQLVCNLFKPDDEILVSFDLYGGTFRLFDFYTKQYNIKFKYVDFADVDAVKEQLTNSTKAFFIEPITNPS